MDTHKEAPSEESWAVTRREFLKVSAATGAVVLLGGCISARLESAGKDPAVAAAADEHQVMLRVNGTPQSLTVESRVTLLDALRERLAFTGTKKGCDHGQCGACTILVNGQRVNSCLALAVMHDGADITTVEGLTRGDQFHPLQTAFIKHDAFQCGYCTSGQLCSAVGLLREGHAHSDADIRELMSGKHLPLWCLPPTSSRPCAKRAIVPAA